MTKFYTDKQQIIAWLKKHKVKNYTLVPDEQYGFIVNAIGDVDLSDRKLFSIPVKFNAVTGGFYCSNNRLTSLEFCPQTVGNGFHCDNNQLISLEFSPETVGSHFSCNNNQLTSLEFSPQTVGGNFHCSENRLISLEFCPQIVGDSFYCENNPELKEIQEITDFKLIDLEHKKILIAKFSDKLENDLINDNSKKSARIKI